MNLLASFRKKISALAKSKNKRAPFITFLKSSLNKLITSCRNTMQRFTREQIREYNDAFVMFDKDGSGDIGSIELRDMLKTVGFNPTDALLERLTLEIDNDGNGMINFEEFMSLIDGLEDWEKNDREARDAFNAFDVMGRGFIETKEIEAAMMFILTTASGEEQQDVVKHFKLRPNRKVYFKEFKDMITQKP